MLSLMKRPIVCILSWSMRWVCGCLVILDSHVFKMEVRGIYILWRRAILSVRPPSFYIQVCHCYALSPRSYPNYFASKLCPISLQQGFIKIFCTAREVNFTWKQGCIVWGVGSSILVATREVQLGLQMTWIWRAPPFITNALFANHVHETCTSEPVIFTIVYMSTPQPNTKRLPTIQEHVRFWDSKAPLMRP